MTLEKVCLLADGRVKAVYADGDIVILSRNGAMFAYISGDNVVRQTCAFAVSRYTERLCTALAFRNMHVDMVVWCRALERRHQADIFKLGYPLSYVRWPECLSQATSGDCLQTLADGRISLQSEDETARLVLHPHGRRFAVCFPLFVGKVTDESGAVNFHFMWQTQVFATADCPARWTYPLNMAMRALQEQRGQSNSSIQSAAGAQTGPDKSGTHAVAESTVDGHDLDQNRKSDQLMDRTTHLPYASEPPYENPHFFEEGSWWTSTSLSALPEKDIVQICWNPEVFIQFIPSVREVHAWVTQDESFLCTSDNGRFLRHQRAPDAESLYRSNALPVHAWSADGSGRYSFQPIAQAVLKFRQHALDVLDAEAIAKDLAENAAAKQPKPEVVSNQIKSKQTVRGVGVFVAFVDGRVRARFDDRTIVAIDRWHKSAEVVQRDSTCKTVSVSAPHGVTEYVKATMEFAKHAFMTPEAREKAEHGRRAVQAALQATKCITAVCEYAISSKLPDEVAVEETWSQSSHDVTSHTAAQQSIPVETPALQARPDTSAGTSACRDPQTGWTVSMHGGPQRAFVGITPQPLQQENMAPANHMRHRSAAKLPPQASVAASGCSVQPVSGQERTQQKLGNGSPRTGKTFTLPDIGTDADQAFSGDRDSLVEQWLKRNSQLLESLDL